MKDRSGSRWWLSGVGTQMMIASTSGMREKSVVASKLPAHHRGDVAGEDVLDRGLARVQCGDALAVDIEAQDGKADPWKRSARGMPT